MAMETGDDMQQQHFCLRWNNYQSNMTSVFDQLRADETFVDVTLACEGKHLKAHKVVLSACSPYFKSVLLRNPCKHPIIILPRDVRYVDLCNVIEFVYRGEIDVAQEQLNNLLQTADQLQIKGLCEVGDVRTCPVVPLHRLPSPSADPRRIPSTTATVCESSNRRKQYLSSIPPRKLSPARCESPMDDESWSAVAAADDTDDDGSDSEPCCDYTAANTGDSCWPSGEAGQLNGSSGRAAGQQLRCGSPASRHSSSPPASAADHQLRSSPADNTAVAAPVCTIQPIQLQDAPLDLAAASCGSGPGLLSVSRTLDVAPCSLQMFPTAAAAQQSSAAAAGATQQQAYQAAIAAITAANTSLYQLSQPQHTPVSVECDRKLWSEDSMEMALDSLRTQRMTLSKASVTYGIPSTTLWQRAHKIGIETPKKDGSNKNWTEDDLKLALNDLRNGKMSANKASKWYGIPNSTLYKIAKKEGIKLSAPFSNAQTSWKPADLERALLAIRGGMSVMKAGSEFGIPAGTLYGRCRRAGIELKPAGQPWNEHDMQHALQALQRGDMSINRAAQHFNLPYSSLYGRSKRHGLLPDTVPLSLLAPTDLQPSQRATPPAPAATHTGTHTDG